MNISVKFRIPDYAIITDKEIIFTPIVASNIFMGAQAHLTVNVDSLEKTYPFQDRCSRLVELNETITLPAFAEAAYIPEENDIDGSAASFSGNYKIENNQIQLSEKIIIKKRLFEPDEWTNYRSVVKAQQKFAKEKIILSR
jgi:hypothetical protein